MSAYSYSESVRSGLNDFDPNQHVKNTAIVSVLQDARLNYCGEL
jgi:acyl-CoA thioesterase FadM